MKITSYPKNRDRIRHQNRPNLGENRPYATSAGGDGDHASDAGDENDGDRDGHDGDGRDDDRGDGGHRDVHHDIRHIHRPSHRIAVSSNHLDNRHMENRNPSRFLLKCIFIICI